MKEFLKTATSFVGFPIKRQPKKYYPDHTTKCPVCKGHGGWNLELNAYGKGEHFNASCFQCMGWGWVKPGLDATCIHDFQDYAVPAGHRSGIHHARCTRCNRETSYDTSD